MKISREDVLRVAELAHLELAAEEVEMYRGQLDSILTYIDKLKALDVSGVQPMSQVTFGTVESADTYGLYDSTATDGLLDARHPEFRDDVLRPCGTAADLFEQAPDAAKPFFRVPKVIER